MKRQFRAERLNFWTQMNVDGEKEDSAENFENEDEEGAGGNIDPPSLLYGATGHPTSNPKH